MDIRVLRYFVAVAREQNFSRAADSLHVSQPALSRQIQDLETELGTKLFSRAHRQILLTQEGHYLMQRAEEIISIVDKTTYNLQKQDIISGTLDIGAGESIGLRPVMQTIQQIVRQYPEVHINLKSGDSEDIKAKLDAGTLEFAVIMGHQQLSQYNTLTLPDENQWGALMRKDEQLASHEVITASDLLGRPLIGSGQMMRLATFREWSHNLIDQYNFIGTYNLIFNAKLLVETGAGIALTYKDLVDTTGDTDLIFRPLSPKMSEPNTLIWPKNHSLPNVSQLFLDTLKQNI